MDCANGNENESCKAARPVAAGWLAHVTALRARRATLLAGAIMAGMVVLSGEANAVCTPTVAGEVLSCAGATSNPAAFTATDDFSVTLEGDPTAAVITRDDNSPGLSINAGDHAGDITVESGASITTGFGGGNRHGLVVTSTAATTEKVYTINIDGSVTSSDDNGDSLRLDGTAYSTFNVFVGTDGILGNSQTGGDDGIIVLGGLNFSLENHGTVAGGSWPGAGWTDGGAEGVLITGDSGTPGNRIAGTVSIDNYGTIRGNGPDEDYSNGQAIYASAEGAIIVNNYEDGGISGDSQGVLVNGGSTVDIANSGTIEGRHGAGVEVYAGTTVRVSNDATITGQGDGVYLHDVDDAVVDNDRGEITSETANGVNVADIADDVWITNRFGSIVGNDGEGIAIEDVGGDVTINNMLFGRIRGEWDGIQAAEVEGQVRIFNILGGRITGSGGDGIDLDDIDDDVIIANSFGGRIAGDDDGIAIDDVWRGDVAILNDAGTIRGRDGNGIDIDDIDGDVAIVNRYGGRIIGENSAISIDDVNGDIAIYNHRGTIYSSDGDGIDISDADGQVTIENGRGSIRGDESAIAIEAQSVVINSRGLIRGEGTDGSPTISVDTESGATINNGRRGLIRGDDRSSDELIVAASGGAVEINNYGDMIGRIDLSSAGDSQSYNVVNNYSDDSWTFTGTSEYGGGLSDEFNNTGTTHTTDPDDASANDSTTLAGLEAFNNGDADNDGVLTMQDGYTGDVTTITPTDGGVLLYSGYEGDGFLDVDGFLGSPATSASDLLVINGDVAGATGVNLADLNSGFGAYDPTGTVVVDVNGETGAGDFFLVGGPVDKGLFQYDLALNPDNEWVLASAPSQHFFELPSLVSATQAMWQNSAGVWLDRTADLRSAFSASCDGGVSGGLKDSPSVCSPSVTPGAWAKVIGTTVSTNQNHQAAIFDNAYDYKIETRQRGYGVVAGFDFGRDVQAANGPAAWMFGLMAGYLKSDLDFDSSSTNAGFEGALVGGYASYISGGWFLDAKIVANIGDMDYSVYAMGTGVKDSANFTSIGGVLDTGYRFNSGATFIEPGATLSYVSTDLDRLSVFDSTVDFGNDDSFRGRLGVRIGSVVNTERYKLEPFIGLSAWYEFLGDNTADVVSGGYVISAENDTGGATAEISGGVNLFSLTDKGLSAFFKGNIELGENDLVGFGGNGGLRYNW